MASPNVSLVTMYGIGGDYLCADLRRQFLLGQVAYCPRYRLRMNAILAPVRIGLFVEHRRFFNLFGLERGRRGCRRSQEGSRGSDVESCLRRVLIGGLDQRY